MGTVSFIELIGFIATIIGISLTTWMLVDVWIDRDYVELHRINGPRRIVAAVAVVREVLRLLLQTAVQVVVVWLMFLPPIPDALGPEIVKVRFAISLVLVIVAVLSAVGSFTDRLARRELVRQFRRGESVWTGPGKAPPPLVEIDRGD